MEVELRVVCNFLNSDSNLKANVNKSRMKSVEMVKRVQVISTFDHSCSRRSYILVIGRPT
jgi:hypothetical protein